MANKKFIVTALLKLDTGTTAVILGGMHVKQQEHSKNSEYLSIEK